MVEKCTEHSPKLNLREKIIVYLKWKSIVDVSFAKQGWISKNVKDRKVLPR